MHVAAPILVLAEGTTVAGLITATAGLCGATATVPTALKRMHRYYIVTGPGIQTIACILYKLMYQQ